MSREKLGDFWKITGFLWKWYGNLGRIVSSLHDFFVRCHNPVKYLLPAANYNDGIVTVEISARLVPRGCHPKKI